MAKATTKVRVEPLKRECIEIPIRGITPLITNAWTNESFQDLRDIADGKKTKKRDPIDRVAKYEGSIYRDRKGRFGVLARSFKVCAVDFAHRDLGIDKTLVRKAFFIYADSDELVLFKKHSEPIMREDWGRPGGRGNAMLFYRACFEEWEMKLRTEFDPGLMRPEDVVNLLSRAGSAIGVGAWRPACDGEFGRFEVAA